MGRKGSIKRLVRKVFRNKLLMTAAFAALGGLMVALSPEEGRWLLWAGATVMLASPWISYVLIMVIYRDAVLNYREDEAGRS